MENGIEARCWTCAKSCGGKGCPWVDNYPSGITEVEGSTFVTKYENRYRVKVVVSCPMYEQDNLIPRKLIDLDKDVKENYANRLISMKTPKTRPIEPSFSI
jgi:hypothetical protein